MIKEGSNSRPAIQLEGVTRWFGSTCAVDRVSFEVQPGEVFGFIGPNGAGKTTSMRVLATLDIPDQGSAYVDGFSVIDDPDRVRRRLGFMPDGFGTYANVNCEEYLDFFARAYGLRGNERRQALRRTMGFTQLDGMAQKPVNGLSKGMKQRLCLGRALIHDPIALILDEPAAGLDPRARIELREMISELKDAGKSLLVSSHILTELAEMCDRVGIIEQGRLLAVGTVDEILSGSLMGATGQSGDASTNEAARIRIVATIVDGIETAGQWLSEQPDVEVIKKIGRMITFDYINDPTRRAELLKAMVDHGVKVADFSAQQQSLEDAFLQVTRGRVQ